jgi:tetratricopeptide (TPR) repeat protein
LDVDDSPAGRRLFSRQKDYEMSPIVRKWGDVQQVLKLLEKDEDFEGADILPDAIPSTRDILSSIRYSRSLGASSGVTPIGNDLMRLPDVLRQNLYTCVRSIIDGDDVPVESPIEDLQHRVSLIRLRHQADALGLSFDPKLPWAFHIKDSEKSLGQEYSVVHTADLVPDHPSDWIPYDDDMCRKAWSFSRYFNTEEYEDYYSEAYKNSEALEHFLYKPKLPSSETASEKSSISNKDDGGAKDTTIECSSTRARLVSSSEEEVETPSDHLYTVYHHLLETVQLLKEAGNEALRNDDCQTAARRYDKAIQYAAVASMSFPNHKLDFAKGRLEMLKETGGLHLEWGPLLKTLISCRLNMALLMLKPDFVYPEQALEQAKLAVRELKPFCMKKRKVMMGPKLANVYNDDEDQETYEEATVLLAKAYFRLGSAYYDLENFSDAIKSFENSVGALQKTGTKPDRALLKRLSEAKRQDKKHSERQRKKFKFAFGHEEEDSDEN